MIGIRKQASKGLRWKLTRGRGMVIQNVQRRLPGGSIYKADNCGTKGI